MCKEPEDIRLFRQAMQGVRRLVCDKIPVYSSLPPPFPQQRYLEEELIRQDMLSDIFDPTEMETGEELVFARTGIQHAIFNKLRRGQLSIRAELDLHGMFVREAYAAIADFLKFCQENQVRCVRIVHGKGYNSWQKRPVLKTKLNDWLRQQDAVMAFCSARPTDGGTGAIYVLIKHR